MQFEGKETLSGDLDLCCFMGGGEGGECDEGAVELFVLCVRALLRGDFGVQASKFRARPVNRVDLPSITSKKRGIPSYRRGA